MCANVLSAREEGPLVAALEAPKDQKGKILPSRCARAGRTLEA